MNITRIVGLLLVTKVMGGCSSGGRHAESTTAVAAQSTERVGKPDTQDVILLIMQHANVALPPHDASCHEAGRTPEETARKKTLGEYLSIYWQDHTEQTGHNFISVQVEADDRPKDREKHWRVTFELRGMAEEDPWDWGVRFYVSDRGWRVWKNEFLCTGTG